MAAPEQQPEEPVNVGFYSLLFGGWAAGSFVLLALGITGAGPYTIETSLAAVIFITAVTFYYAVNT